MNTHLLKFRTWLFFAFLSITANHAMAQNNIAPSATVSAFGNNMAPFNWNLINDLDFGTCGIQQAFVWTTSPPNGTEWMNWEWSTPQRIQRIVIHHADPTTRFLTGGTIQIWNGSAYVNVHTFSGLPQVCSNTVVLPFVVTTTQLRITNFVMGTGQNSNPNFREIEVISAPSSFNDAGVVSIDSPATFATGNQNVVARIRNFGLNVITSVDVFWELNGTPQVPASFTGTLDTIGGAGSNTALVNLGSVNFLNNTMYRIKAWTANPNFQTDTINTNDTTVRFLRSPLNGSYTIGATNCDFVSITEATNVLRIAGVNGPVTFNLVDPLYSTSTGETFPILLNAVNGMSATNTVRFKPLSGNNVLISAAHNGPLFFIDNGSNYILDGRDTLTATTRNLTLENLSTANAATLINLANDAIGNTIRNLNLRFSSTSTTLGAINLQGSNRFQGNDNNQILNNYFTRASIGTYAVGLLSTGASAIVQNNDNIISGNEFNGFTFNGISINGSGNGSNWQITNNSFYDTATTTTQLSIWCAINFIPGTGSGSVNNLIANNFIGGRQPLAGGAAFTNNTAVTRVAIQVTTSVGTPNQIYGNEIRNWFLPNTSATASFTGIQVSGGSAVIDSNTFRDFLTFNDALTIGINVTTFGNYDITRNMIHSIRHINIGTMGAIRGIVTSSGQNVNILNNTIRGLRTNSRNTGQSTVPSLAGIVSQSSSNSVRIAGNLIGTLAEPLLNAHDGTGNVCINGIVSSSGINVIEDNIIDGLMLDSTAQSSFSTSTGASINGILAFSGSAGQIIRNNRVLHLYQRSAAATQTSQINGICYASSGFTTIHNNFIYGLFSRSTNTSTSTSAALNAINFASSGRAVITNNYIDSIVLLPATISSNQVNGIVVFGTSGNFVSGNTIKTVFNTFTTSNPGICGIQYISSVINQVCDSNIIFGLSNRHTASTGTITGIRYLASTQILDNNSSVTRNFVHSFSSLSTSATTWNGIEIASGMMTCANNLIRLGVDTNANFYSTPIAINGINYNTTGTTFMNRFYHNTSYIAGAPTTGTSQTAAFRALSAASSLLDIRNNIFVNVVSNTGASGVNAAIALGSSIFAGSIINYNLLWAGTGLTNNFIGTGPGNATVMTGLSGWRRISNTESNGIHGNPLLVAPNAIPGSINLQPAVTNLAEGSGDPTVAAFVSIDYAGNDRANNTPTDIGAWSSATNTLAADSVAPEISFTALTNTASVINRTFTATIIDRTSGVQAGTLAPRVYFNKNNGAYFSTQGTLVAGNHRNGTWEFTIDYSLLSGVVPNDVIRYYVIAQDSVGQYSTLPAYAIATNTTTVANPPVTPFQYLIANPIPLTVTVGPTSTYPTLTGTNGLFNAINNSLLQGNTTVLLEAGTVISEPGSVALNQWLEISGGVVGNYNYTLTIRPSAPAQVTLTGNVTTADGMIRLNGADRVTFLGYAALGLPTDTSLVIRNIATSQPALTLLNDATNNRFEQVIFETRNTNTGVTTGGAVRISPTSLVTGNDNNSFIGCHFRRDITNLTFPGTPGILFAASGTFGVNRENDNLLIEDCKFYNFNFNAISIGSGTGNNQVIKNNHFYQNDGFSHTTSPTVINFTPGNLSNNDTISGNTIGGNNLGLQGNWVVTTTATSLTFTGINVTAGAISGTTITNNRIANILHNQTVASTFTGILVNNGGGVARIENNYIGDTLLSDNILHSGNTTTLAISCQTGSNSFINNNLIANITNNNPAGTSVIVNGIRSWNQTGVLEIRNNRIVNLKDSSNGTSTSTGACMVGINVSSSTTAITIDNNHINGLQNASISAGTTNQVLGILSTGGLAQVTNNVVENVLTRSLNTSTSTGAALIGIWISSFTPNQFINNNTVRYLTYNNPAPTTTQIIGIMQSSGSGHSITNNLVHNLKSNSTSANTSVSSAIIGIMHNGSGSAINISRNTIHTLEGQSNASNNIVGIMYQGTTTIVTNHIARNIIHSFKHAGTSGGRMIGIQQNIGSFTRYANNMIRLGLDSAGSAYTGPLEIYGILTDLAGNFEYYHNSIYLGGAPSSGIAVTAAIRLQGTPTGTQSYDIRNNILVNAISNGGTAAGKNFALRVAAIPTNPTGIVSNYNIMQATGTGGFIAGTNIVDYPNLFGINGWKRATGYDLQSASVNPQFQNATGSADVVDLRLMNNNPAEGSGDPLVANIVTEDIDGRCRACSTAVDIGAHAGNFVLSADSIAPVITYTPIGNQGNLTGPLVFSGVNIKDNMGIPLANTLTSPKLYYKKGLAGTYNSISASSYTGNPTDANLTFQIQYGALGGVSIGDTIYYFVIAEDSLGANVNSHRPFAIASGVNNVIVEPQVIDFYTFLPVIPANTKYYVGSGQPFTTLTGPGGLFEHLNNNTIGGNITAVITSNITEPGTFALNEIGEAGPGAGTYTITIRPDSSAIATTRILTGSVNVGMIRLNGSDRVKISGVPDLSTNNSLNNLMLRNASNGPVVLFVNGAQQNRLNNLIIEGFNNTTFNLANSGLVSFSGSTNGIGNNQDSVINCIIRNDQSVSFPAGVPNTLISSAHSGLTLNSNNVILNNHLSNASAVYINVDAGSGNGWVVNGNSCFNNLPVLTTNVLPIRFNGGIISEGHTINGNIIGGTAPNAGGTAWISNVQATWNQIQVNVGINLPTTISGNIIRNQRFVQFSSGNQWNGIFVTAGRTVITNNMIGDSTNIGSIELNPPTNHNAITLGGGVTSPTMISGNRISGLVTNSPGNTTQIIGIFLNGGITTVTGNIIGAATIPNSIVHNANSQVRGILIQTPANIDPATQITDNIIANISCIASTPSVTLGGIQLSGTTAANISNNRIFNLSSNSSNISLSPTLFSVFGITTAATTVPGVQINNNTIHGLVAANTGSLTTNAAGIQLNGSTNNTVNGNRIYDIRNLSTATTINPMATASGIVGWNITNFAQISNNQITLGHNQNNGVQYNGIWQLSSGGFDYNYYNNTVLVTGNATGNIPSYAFHRGQNTTGEITSGVRIVNNAFINNRAGGNTKNYAIANEVSGTVTGGGWLEVNYNFLSSANPNTVGLWGSTDRNIAAWTASSNADRNSWSEATAIVNPNTLFVDVANGNLNVVTTSPLSWYLNGKGIAGNANNNLNSDFAGNARGTTFGFGVDIGSHEFNTTTIPPALTVSGAPAANTTTVLSFASRTIASVTWGSGGTMPTAITGAYYSGVNPPSTFPNTRFLNAYVDLGATGGSGYNYIATLHYDPALLGNVLSESNLRLASRVNNLWGFDNNSTVNTTAKTITNGTANTAMGVFTGTDVTAPLPVQLTNFTATANDNHVLLSWTTASELNNKGFEVERSSDGNKFEYVGFVKGKGTTQRTNSYNLTDKDAFNRSNLLYYRLKQIDFDGSYSYSNIVLVSKFGEDVFVSNVYPNPFIESFNIDVVTPVSGTTEITVVDITGKEIATKSIEANVGKNTIFFNEMAHVNSGIYFVKVKQGTYTGLHKVVSVK
jgi:hypothetical protein